MATRDGADIQGDYRGEGGQGKREEGAWQAGWTRTSEERLEVQPVDARAGRGVGAEDEAGGAEDGGAVDEHLDFACAHA